MDTVSKRILLLTILILVASINIYAETGPLGWGQAGFFQEMATDRPDFTESPQTVQSGHLQFELGYTFAEDSNFKSYSTPEALARIGISENSEIRIFWEGYINEISNIVDDNKGVSDLSLGFKNRIFKRDGLIPDLSYLGELVIPVGSSEISSDELGIIGKLLWGYDFKNFGIAGNVNFDTPIGEDGRYLEVGNSISIATNLTRDFGSYFEYFGLYPTEDVVETTQHYLNGGFTYTISGNLQLDIRAGFGLNEAADDFFSGTGVSLRF